MTPQAANQYLRTKVLTATPEQLQMMLFDGALVFCEQARLALMAQTIQMYHLVHGELGKAVVNAVITLTGLAWAAASVRHEIFD